MSDLKFPMPFNPKAGRAGPTAGRGGEEAIVEWGDRGQADRWTERTAGERTEWTERRPSDRAD